MGRSILPKYRVELDGNKMVWNVKQAGSPNNKNLEKWIFVYAASLRAGGVNFHISQALGYMPYPRKAQVVNQVSGEIVAKWESWKFQVYQSERVW